MWIFNNIWKIWFPNIDFNEIHYFIITIIIQVISLFQLLEEEKSWRSEPSLTLHHLQLISHTVAFWDGLWSIFQQLALLTSLRVTWYKELLKFLLAWWIKYLETEMNQNWWALFFFFSHTSSKDRRCGNSYEKIIFKCLLNFIFFQGQFN